MENFIVPKGWLKTERDYKGYRLIMLSKFGSGIKCHVFKDGKVIFTHRWSFIPPEQFYTKVANKLDQYIDGTWKPKKEIDKINQLK